MLIYLRNTTYEVVIPQSIATPIPPGGWTELAAVAGRYVKDQGTRVHSKN